MQPPLTGFAYDPGTRVRYGVEPQRSPAAALRVPWRRIGNTRSP